MEQQKDNIIMEYNPIFRISTHGLLSTMIRSLAELIPRENICHPQINWCTVVEWGGVEGAGSREGESTDIRPCVHIWGAVKWQQPRPVKQNLYIPF